MISSGTKGKIRILFLLKGPPEGISTAKLTLFGLPRERYWGLELLQEREEFHVTPWMVAGQSNTLMERIALRIFPPPTMFGYAASRSLLRRLKYEQGQYDLVLSFNHVPTASLLVLKRQRLFRPPIVCLAIGIPDRLENGSPGARSRTLDYLARADRLLAMSNAEVDFFQAMGLSQTIFLPYGVDTEYWSQDNGPVEDYIFAVGSDPCRDFDTLIQSCPYPLKIMTRSRHLVTVPLPNNSSFVQGDTETLRSLYARARVVVVPLKDRLQPSGQNTVLQAMAMGKPVILTRTRGIWSEELRHRENCFYVKPGDSNELREALRLLYDDRPLAQAIGKRAHMTVERHFDVRWYASALSQIVCQVLGH